MNEIKPKVIEIPLNELEAVDISDKKIETMARGFILGSQAMGRRKEIRQELEERVTKRIGRKGKFLVDKLFELIEGVAIVDKKDGRQVRYYMVPPNLQAIIYALDRVLGRPKQHTEHTEEKRGILLVEHIIKNLAGEKNEGTNIGENKRVGGIRRAGEGIGFGSGSGGEAVGDASGVNVGVGSESL